MNAAVATQDQVFRIKCRIVRWLDADSLELHPIYAQAGVNRHVRLQDEWAPELWEKAHDAVLAEQVELIGAAGGLCWMANTRHHPTFDRIEARVDKA